MPRKPITDTDRIDLLQQLTERPGFIGDVTISGHEDVALEVHAGPSGAFQKRIGWGDDLRGALDKVIRRKRRARTTRDEERG